MKYKIIINPEVYISVETSRFLMYNTSNGKYLNGIDKTISEILRKIKNNNYMCMIDYDTFNNKKIFIQEISKKGLGDCIPIKYVKGCVQSIPILNIHKDMRRIQGNINNEIGINLMTCLYEINIFVELDCQLNCELCKIAFLQNCCCSKFSCRNDVNALIAFLKRSKILPMTKLNLIICGSMRHGDFIAVFERISEIHSIYSVYVIDANFCFNIASLLDCKFYVTILPPFADTDYYTSANIEYIFFVSNVESLESANEIINKHELQRCRIVPLATGRNSTFFNKYVFLSPKEVLRSHHNFKDIYRNQTLNSFLFGIINIMPNGKVYASLNKNELGNIYDNSLYEIVKAELMQGSSWMFTRQKMAYCKHCTYTDLCPSVSECELFLGSRICKNRK